MISQIGSSLGDAQGAMISRPMLFVGFLSGIIAVATPSVDSMDYVVFSIGNVLFPVKDIIAIVGGVASLVIAVFTVVNLISRIKKNRRLAKQKVK